MAAGDLMRTLTVEASIRDLGGDAECELPGYDADRFSLPG
jgi:hypothetical protein